MAIVTGADRRVIVLSPGTDGTAGGVERFTDLLRLALARDGLEVAIATPAGPPSRTASRTGAGFLVTSRSSAQQAARLGAALYICNGTLGWGLPRGARRVHVLHGTMPEAMRRTPTLPRRERLRAAAGGGLAECLAGRRATTVAVSRSAAAEAEHYYRRPVDHIIENGVDVDLFRPRDRRHARRVLGLPVEGRLALFVGRAEPRKAPEVAADTARAAGFELMVAGSRPIAGARHLGTLAPEQLAWAYAAADCLLMPTYYEACSYAVLEAMAVGTPVVTTAVGWACDLLAAVPEYACLVARCNDVALMTGAMHHVGSLPAGRAVGLAREHVRRHNAQADFADTWRSLICRDLLLTNQPSSR